MRLSSLVILVAVSWLSNGTAWASGPSAGSRLYLIVPGESISTIMIGMPKDTVQRGWGRPDSITEELGTIYRYGRFATAMRFDLRDRVAEIWTWDARMRTKQGIGVGTPLSIVTRIFGRAQAGTLTSDLDLISVRIPGMEYSRYLDAIYHTEGIAFRGRKRVLYDEKGTEVDRDFIVIQVRVMRPK